MLQHSAQLLLPDVARKIDDLHYQNFHIPALMHQNRLIKSDTNGPRFYAAVESDYVDAQEQFTYQSPVFPLRDILDGERQQRLEIAIDLLKAALNGKTISIGKLRRALTAVEFAEYRTLVAQVAEQSEIMFGDGAPEQLKRYNKKLNAADFMFARYEAMPAVAKTSNKRKVSPSQVEDRAVSLYEDALEDLEETFVCAARGDWGADMLPRLQNWMDRPVDFDAGVMCTLGPDAHSVPRVRGSKSAYALDSGLPKLSKRIKQKWCALNALLMAVCEIAFVVPHIHPVVLTSAQSLDLKNKLAQLKKRTSH